MDLEREKAQEWWFDRDLPRSHGVEWELTALRLKKGDQHFIIPLPLPEGFTRFFNIEDFEIVNKLHLETARGTCVRVSRPLSVGDRVNVMFYESICEVKKIEEYGKDN